MRVLPCGLLPVNLSQTLLFTKLYFKTRKPLRSAKTLSAAYELFPTPVGDVSRVKPENLAHPVTGPVPRQECNKVEHAGWHKPEDCHRDSELGPRTDNRPGNPFGESVDRRVAQWTLSFYDTFLYVFTNVLSGKVLIRRDFDGTD